MKTYGCPNCGSSHGFREIDCGLVDYKFTRFADTGHGPGVLDYDDVVPDTEGCRAIVRGAYQCDGCDAHFDDPAELPPGFDAAQYDPAVSGPLRPDLVIPAERVIWSDRDRLDERELATVLAALRNWQRSTLDGNLVNDALADLATNGGTLDNLNAIEIDALCERLNK